MKKTSLFLFLMMLGLGVSSFSKTLIDDFFVGKWEIVVVGTPNGDTKLLADLTRKDGKLTGELTNTNEPGSPKIPIESITEAADKLSMTFTAQGYNVTMDLTKVDDDNLKGSLMGGMFDATAKRVK